MKIIDSKLQGNVLQEFTDDYLEKHKELIKYVKEETKKQLTLTDVSQQRELLNALADTFNESTHTYVGQPMIEETLKAFNCG